jgi:ectoine hydroxylase-related dioxygenase (phytanoyl-CoA dioxygenase family)
VSHPHALSAEQLADYDRDGYLVLRGVLPPTVLDQLRAVFTATVDRLAAQWKAEGLIEDAHQELPFETRFAALRTQNPARFATSWRKTLIDPAVYQLWQLPELVGPVRSLLGDELYAHGVWNGRPREPHDPIQKVLWHQDAHYYKNWDPTDGGLVSVWMPLVPVDAESGCLEMAAGSHRSGWIERHRGFNRLFTVADEALEGTDQRAISMQPGDVLMFSDTTLHQALHNTSDRVRWSIDIRFGQATPEIISKTPRGYYCFSASDPGRVESYDTWVDRYDYSKVGLDAEIEDLDTTVDLDDAAKAMGISRSELEVF